MKLRSGFTYTFVSRSLHQRVFHPRRECRLARLRTTRARLWRACGFKAPQVASALNVPDLTRFKIKETSSSTAQWTREWATKALARRFISSGVESATHMKPGLDDRGSQPNWTSRTVQITYEWKSYDVGFANPLTRYIAGKLGVTLTVESEWEEVYLSPSSVWLTQDNVGDDVAHGDRCYCRLCKDALVTECELCHGVARNRDHDVDGWACRDPEIDRSLAHLLECDSSYTARYRARKSKDEETEFRYLPIPFPFR